MKLTTKQLKTLKTIYLYGDGHAALIHEKRDDQAGRIEWVELVEELGPKCYFAGRLIFSSFSEYRNYGLARIVATAEKVSVDKASITNGSQNSQEKCQPVGYLHITTKDGYLTFTELPGLMSGEYTYQDDLQHRKTWNDVKDLYSWGSMNISKKHPKDVESISIVA